MAERTPRYAGYIFDLDGTIYLGGRLIPGAQETIAWLRRHGRPVVFLSNKPLEPRGAYAAKLTRLGIAASEADVVNSTQALMSYLRAERPDVRLYVIGEPTLLNEFRAEGFALTERLEEIEIVVAAFDRTLTYAKLNLAYQALMRGAGFVATNSDRSCPVEGGAIPDCAGVIAFLEATTGRACELIAGKPSPLILGAALGRLGVSKEQALMVGDRLATDIRMGNDLGLDTGLVLTGVTTRAMLAESSARPTFILSSVADIP